MSPIIKSPRAIQHNHAKKSNKCLVSNINNIKPTLVLTKPQKQKSFGRDYPTIIRVLAQLINPKLPKTEHNIQLKWKHKITLIQILQSDWNPRLRIWQRCKAQTYGDGYNVSLEAEG